MIEASIAELPTILSPYEEKKAEREARAKATLLARLRLTPRLTFFSIRLIVGGSESLAEKLIQQLIGGGDLEERTDPANGTVYHFCDQQQPALRNGWVPECRVYHAADELPPVPTVAVKKRVPKFDSPAASTSNPTASTVQICTNLPSSTPEASNAPTFNLDCRPKPPRPLNPIEHDVLKALRSPQSVLGLQKKLPHLGSLIPNVLKRLIRARLITPGYCQGCLVYKAVGESHEST